MLFVPVVDKNQNPLMPTTPNRASTWIKSGKATPFWKRGVFCVRLNQEPSARITQEIVVGVDPGSKRESFTVKSASHTFLNIQSHTVDWVKSAVETRRNLRKSRRQRNTPYRKCRWNRATLSKPDRIPPSTRARWGFKLRILKYISRLYPISDIVVEDIQAKTRKGGRLWNKNFSPLEVGKQWFYAKCRSLGNLSTISGYETSQMRKALGLTKDKSNKLGNGFDVHCVDSWVLANSIVGGHQTPENTRLIELIPIRLHRRQLHMQNFAKGGVRKTYGGTRSLGFTRGSLVKHVSRGLCYIGGSSNGRISLHSVETGLRLCQNAKVADIKFLSYNPWRWHSSLG